MKAPTSAWRRTAEGDIVVPLYPLSCGLRAIISASDAPLVLPYKWWRLPDKQGRCYAVGRVPHGKYMVRVLMHRWLLEPQPKERVDHANGDGLDNRRENIRPCNASQNAANMRKKAGSSRFKGVKRERTGRWIARVTAHYKQHHIGTHDDEAVAAAAYDIAARHFHGAFARTNFGALILEQDETGAWVEHDPMARINAARDAMRARA